MLDQGSIIKHLTTADASGHRSRLARAVAAPGCAVIHLSSCGGEQFSYGVRELAVYNLSSLQAAVVPVFTVLAIVALTIRHT